MTWHDFVNVRCCAGIPGNVPPDTFSNASRQSPSRLRNGHLKVVQWLAKNGGSVIEEDSVRAAARGGHLNVVPWLAEIGRRSTKKAINESTSLNFVAFKGNLEVVQWPARNGESVTQPDSHGGTPLRAAAQVGHLEVVQWLARNRGSDSVNQAIKEQVKVLLMAKNSRARKEPHHGSNVATTERHSSGTTRGRL